MQADTVYADAITVLGVERIARPGPLAARPDLSEAMGAMLATLKANRRLPERLVELVRLRVAFRNQCRVCMSVRYSDALDDGLTESLVCSLEKPQDAPDMSDAEKAAVAYADKFATDHLAIDRELEALKAHFDDGEIAELAIQVACFVGFGRVAAIFDADDELPVGDRNADGSPLAPWRLSEPLRLP